MIMPRSDFPFQYGATNAHRQPHPGSRLQRLAALSGYGQDEWQPLTFDDQGNMTGTGIAPSPPAGGGSGGGSIPYYLAASNTPSDQIDWSTYNTQPTGYDQPGPAGSSTTYTTAGGDSGASFWTSLVGGFVKSIGGGNQPPPVRYAPPPQPGVPGWAWALGAVGAVGVVAILLKK